MANTSREEQSERRLRRHRGPVRYAVVGLGHIAQVAVLPAFANARSNSQLVALVSDDRRKLAALGRRYDVAIRADYSHYDNLLASGDVDAVYIALPNSMHRDHVVRAARAGVHVLCEKPMATTRRECSAMIDACGKAGVRLMVAYRLHFDVANLRAVAIAQAGRLGDVRAFTSTFTMQVRDPSNIRLKSDLGGGPLFDIGIYCINAARMLFRSEPVEVFATAVSRGDRRFAEVPEMVSAVLRYPDERLATFTCSFGAADVSAYQLVGTSGSLRLQGAYDFAKPREMVITVGKSSRRIAFGKRDQFAAELLYFSRCVKGGTEPEPGGTEGLADVAIIDALRRSIKTGRPVRIDLAPDRRLPTSRQRIDRPPVRKRKPVHARGPRTR